MAGSNNVYPERHPGIGTTVGELAGTLTDICLLSKVKWLPPSLRASLSEFGSEVANQAATGAIYSGLLTPVQQGQEQFKARLQGAFVGAGTFGCMGAAAQWGPYASGLAGGLANVQFDALAHGQAIGNASDYLTQPLAFMVTNKLVEQPAIIWASTSPAPILTCGGNLLMPGTPTTGTGSKTEPSARPMKKGCRKKRSIRFSRTSAKKPPAA